MKGTRVSQFELESESLNHPTVYADDRRRKALLARAASALRKIIKILVDRKTLFCFDVHVKGDKTMTTRSKWETVKVDGRMVGRILKDINPQGKEVWRSRVSGNWGYTHETREDAVAVLTKIANTGGDMIVMVK